MRRSHNGDDRGETERACSVCRLVVQEVAFSRKQWEGAPHKRRCLACARGQWGCRYPSAHALEVVVGAARAAAVLAARAQPEYLSLLHPVNRGRFEDTLMLKAEEDVRRELVHLQRAKSTVACVTAPPAERRQQEHESTEPEQPAHCDDVSGDPPESRGAVAARTRSPYSARATHRVVSCEVSSFRDQLAGKEWSGKAGQEMLARAAAGGGGHEHAHGPSLVDEQREAATAGPAPCRGIPRPRPKPRCATPGCDQPRLRPNRYGSVCFACMRARLEGSQRAPSSPSAKPPPEEPATATPFPAVPVGTACALRAAGHVPCSRTPFCAPRAAPT